MALTVTLLGTGSPIPDPNRAGPATLVTAGSTRLLVDAGRGVLMRLAGAGVFPVMLDAVLLTHLHSDHITDLNDVITTHWVMCRQPTPLHVYGPPGTDAVVSAVLAMLAPDLGYRRAHHDDLTWSPVIEVHELAAPSSFAVGDAVIQVRATDHRPVEPTVGYRIECDGRSVAIAGDGVPCSGLDELCAGADVYVQTVIRADLVRLMPNRRIQDILDYHSTIEQAAQTATRAGVATLVCTPLRPGDRRRPARCMAGPRRSSLRRRDRPRRRPHHDRHDELSAPDEAKRHLKQTVRPVTPNCLLRIARGDI